MNIALQSIKQRFGIIGHSPILERTLEIACQVAPTDLTILINGESGTGKEVFPQIIHQYSAKKHGNYIAVNCGAIPEGTIDSELFGHEKGSFTGANEERKGYFEVANGGTIFLDEVGELPLPTQARLLRILETGEYMRVGSSKVQKTNVRIVAATNINFNIAIEKGKFREDLYYRLNTVPIILPALRDRKEDIQLLFIKFANDFASKYKIPPIKLTPEADAFLTNYYWPGNIRQLKNITEQISIIEKERLINVNTLSLYLPDYHSNKLPAIINPSQGAHQQGEINERDILYKVLFELKKELDELKQTVRNNITNPSITDNLNAIQAISPTNISVQIEKIPIEKPIIQVSSNKSLTQDAAIITSESSNLSLQESEITLIKKALIKHKGRRKNASQDLGISERTLYRKILDYNITEDFY